MTGKAGKRLRHGPGVSNLVTGLATAHSEGDPMVARGPCRCRIVSNFASDDGLGKCVQAGNEVRAEIDSPASTAEVLTGAFRARNRLGRLRFVTFYGCDTESQCKLILADQGAGAGASVRARSCASD